MWASKPEPVLAESRAQRGQKNELAKDVVGWLAGFNLTEARLHCSAYLSVKLSGGHPAHQQCPFRN